MQEFRLGDDREKRRDLFKVRIDQLFRNVPRKPRAHNFRKFNRNILVAADGAACARKLVKLDDPISVRANLKRLMMLDIVILERSARHESRRVNKVRDRSRTEHTRIWRLAVMSA